MSSLSSSSISDSQRVRRRKKRSHNSTSETTTTFLTSPRSDIELSDIPVVFPGDDLLSPDRSLSPANIRSKTDKLRGSHDEPRRTRSHEPHRHKTRIRRSAEVLPPPDDSTVTIRSFRDWKSSSCQCSTPMNCSCLFMSASLPRRRKLGAQHDTAAARMLASPRVPSDDAALNPLARVSGSSRGSHSSRATPSRSASRSPVRARLSSSLHEGTLHPAATRSTRLRTRRSAEFVVPHTSPWSDERAHTPPPRSALHKRHSLDNQRTPLLQRTASGRVLSLYVSSDDDDDDDDDDDSYSTDTNSSESLPRFQFGQSSEQEQRRRSGGFTATGDVADDNDTETTTADDSSDVPLDHRRLARLTLSSSGLSKSTPLADFASFDQSAESEKTSTTATTEDHASGADDQVASVLNSPKPAANTLTKALATDSPRPVTGNRRRANTLMSPRPPLPSTTIDSARSKPTLLLPQSPKSFIANNDHMKHIRTAARRPVSRTVSTQRVDELVASSRHSHVISNASTSLANLFASPFSRKRVSKKEDEPVLNGYSVHMPFENSSRVTLLDRIGCGGSQATVHRCVVENFLCAVKIYHLDLMTDTERIEVAHEIELQQSLNHENICILFAANMDFMSENEWRIFMPLYDSSLRACLNEAITNPTSLLMKDRLFAATEVAAALNYLHSRRVLHRDIKSENVFVRKGNQRRLLQVVLGDFGEARELEKSLFRTRRMSVNYGTPEFCAPEAISDRKSGKINYDTKADMWAYGMLLFELLTNDVPYHTEGVPAYAILDHISADNRPGGLSINI